MRGIIKQVNRSEGGMPKLRIEGSASIGSRGVDGDRQRNLKYHGGPEKAVLVLAAEVVDDLSAVGFPVQYGSLGENLTVAGLDWKLWRKGQQYRIGEDVVIELTTLRQPCLNLDVYGSAIKKELYDARCRTGDAASPRWARGGFYARVLRDGLVEVGAPVLLIDSIASGG